MLYSIPSRALVSGREGIQLVLDYCGQQLPQISISFDLPATVTFSDLDDVICNAGGSVSSPPPFVQAAIKGSQLSGLSSNRVLQVAVLVRVSGSDVGLPLWAVRLGVGSLRIIVRHGWQSP